ncbi:MAG: hypothetical protein DHS20C05_24730 [Hyphococcus sp.]|nr:MAG: hypothetical protein DHS20C05_24730 [Marinicaulis sp.]
MTEFLKINGGEHIHLSDVKRLRPISDKERVSLASLGEHVDADRFNIRIDHANNTTSYAPETIDQVATQGVSLVQIDQQAFVPRDNINRSRDLTPADRQDFEQKTGRALRSDFKSQIDTRAGRVLSTVDSKTVMRRMGQPYQPNGVTPTANREEASQNAGLEKTRDALMRNTSPALRNAGSKADPSHTPRETS